MEEESVMAVLQGLATADGSQETRCGSGGGAGEMWVIWGRSGGGQGPATRWNLGEDALPRGLVPGGGVEGREEGLSRLLAPVLAPVLAGEGLLLGT